MNNRRKLIITPGAGALTAQPSAGPRWSRIIFLAVLACSAFAVSPASAQRPYTDLPIIREGKTIQLSPNVYVIPDENRRGVPNVGIVVGSRATLVVDPGMGLKSGQAVLREVAKVSKGSEIYIATTHLHPEHTTGEVAFPPSAKIVRAVAQQKDVEENGMKWVAEFSGRSAELTDILKEVKGFRAPSETFEREKTLDLGGVRVKLIWLGAGHTPGDTVIFVEGDAVLFSGDLAMKQVFPAFTSPKSSTDTWLAAVDAMDALRPSHVVGSHYGMGGASMISAYRDFLTALRARVAEMKAQGKSAAEAAKTLRAEFHAKYPDWDQPSRVELAATATYAQLP
jgi:glyoxylase-like metal-dependent hydrolase (beta-lactamase superfamily II)